MKCLIVEDVDFVTEMMTSHLADIAVADTATDGIEALDLFSRAITVREPYDFVCLDIHLPMMDGQRTLKEMRRMEAAADPPVRKAVVFMTTALSETTQMLEALLDGDSTDYLIKPVSREDLVTALKRSGLISV